MSNQTKVLVVGGTGPTGRYLIPGLVDRGYDVTILHRGVHEPDDLPDVRHIHADPNFGTELARSTAGMEFDIVLAMYGRLAEVADIFAGRCRRFIALGGQPVYGGYSHPDAMFPAGMKVPTAESDALADPALVVNEKKRAFIAKIRSAEAEVFRHHEKNSFRATTFRLPYVYGPRALISTEWSTIKRVLDGRSFIAVPNAGLGIRSRCASVNAAKHILLALENTQAEGEAFNACDEDQYSLGQWIEIIAGAMGKKIQLLDVPSQLAWAVSHFLPSSGDGPPHSLLDNSKAKKLLGYTDAMPAAAACAETVQWYLSHPVDPEKDVTFRDHLNYELEDRVHAALESMRVELEKHRTANKVMHPYAHPKAPSAGPDHRGR